MANWYGRICQLQPRKILKRVESSFSKRYFFLIFKTNVDLLCCFQIYLVKVVKVA